jgi:hypothetical protein
MRNQEGISSSEIVVENDGAMIIQGENNIPDQEEYGQEMNIEGGEQNIDDEEPEYGEEQQLPDYGEEEEDDQDPQVFNPQYQLEDDQGEEQEEEDDMMIQNINVQNP